MISSRGYLVKTNPYDGILDNMLSAVAFLNEEGNLVRSNKVFKEEYGEVSNIREILIESDRGVFFDNLMRIIKEKMGYRNFIHTVRNNHSKLCYLNAFTYNGEIIFELMNLELFDGKTAIGRQLSEFFNSMTVGLAHSMRNPIMSMGGMINRMRSKMPRECANAVSNYLDYIDLSLKKMLNLIFNIESINESFHSPLEHVDIASIVAEAIEKLSNTNRVIEFVSHAKGETLVFSNREHLRFIIEELVRNAIEATEDGGRIEIELDRYGDSVSLRISDNGRGIKEKDLQMILVPFFSTKPDRIGLGLSLVKLLVDYYNGKLEITSSEGEGTMIEIILPVERRNPIRVRHLHDILDWGGNDPNKRG